METASKKQSRLPSKIAFGNQVIASNLAFLSAKNAIGIVDNQLPITYNVIILPKRNVSKFGDLNENEAIDLFMFAQKAAKLMEESVDYIKDNNRTVELVLRDGVGAGDMQDQTCIWLVPRRKGERVNFVDGNAKVTTNSSRLLRTDTQIAEELNEDGSVENGAENHHGNYLENLQVGQQQIRDYAGLLKKLMREDRLGVNDNVQRIDLNN